MTFEAEGVKTQGEFLKKRAKTLNKAAGKDLEFLEGVITRLYRKEKGIDPPDWLDVYNRISDSLRMADLTINLNCKSWFSDFNEYAGYTQMYQRGVDRTTGAPVLKADGLNPAAVRAAADDLVTLPPSWKNAPKGSKKRKLYDAMNFSGGEIPERGTTPNDDPWTQLFGRSSGSRSLHLTGDKKEGLYTTTNRHFNPHAKQVFAALNYGRRLLGSSYQYGNSYLVLNPDLKKKALYFPEDTFYLAGNVKKGYSTGLGAKTRLENSNRSIADTQSSYEWLGHILIWASDTMAEQIFKSCHDGIVLSDTKSASDLLEAHVFSDVRMNRDVQTLVLAKEDNMSEDDFDVCKHFAYIWARENNVAVHLR